MKPVPKRFAALAIAALAAGTVAACGSSGTSSSSSSAGKPVKGGTLNFGAAGKGWSEPVTQTQSRRDQG